MHRDPHPAPGTAATLIIGLLVALFVGIMIADALTTTDAERDRDRINETCNGESNPILANACRDNG